MNIVVLVLLGFSALVILATARRGRIFLCFAIGMSAGLILVQFGGLHLYSLLVCAYILISRNLRRYGFVTPFILTVASLLFASTALYGLLVKSDGLAIQLIVMAVTSALLWLRSSDTELRSAVLGLLTIVTGGSVVGLLQTVGVVPMQLFQLADAEMHRPAAWYPEPDWLGLYSAVGVALGLAMIRDGRLRFFMVAVNSVAVLIASARAAWLALLVAACWALIQYLRKTEVRSLRSVRTVALVGLLGVVFAEILFPAQVELALNRVLSAFQPGGGDSAVVARYGQIDGLLYLLATAPPYGHGISAGGRVGGFGQVDLSDGGNSNSTASNWILALLAEGMLLSIPLILILACLALFGSRRLGAQAALLVVLTNSLFSNAFYFPLTWFLVAVAFVRPRSTENDIFEPALAPPRVRRAPADLPMRRAMTEKGELI